MRGFSLIELVIVASVIFVVAGFALTQITSARQVLVRNNATRELTSYIEKARRDSIRRHSTTASQMARVTLLTSSSYSVTLDSDGDGTMDVDRVINLPANSNLSFSGSFPRSVRFDWRGRTADSSGIAATPADITIRNSYGANTINVSRAGQSEVDVAPTTDPISNSTAPGATFRDQTQLP
jgi:type II secretory pathway pseudopilin PulG